MKYTNLQPEMLDFLLIENSQETTEFISKLIRESDFKQSKITVFNALEDGFNCPFLSAANLLLVDLDALPKQASITIARLQQACPNVPLLILYGPQDEVIVRTLIHQNIQGLIAKDRLDTMTLSHALHQALMQARQQEQWQNQVNLLKADVQQLNDSLTVAQSAIEQNCQRIPVLEGILQAIPDAIVFADTEGHVCTVNPAFSEIFHYPPEIILGKTTEQLYENLEGYRGQGQTRFNLQANDDIKVYEERYRRQDGEIFVGETIDTVVKNADGKPLGYLEIIRDVSDRKQAEQALVRSEAISRALLRVIPDRLTWVRKDGACLQIEGQSIASNQDFCNTTIHSYLTSQQAAQKIHYIQQALETGQVKEYERRCSSCRTQSGYEEVRIVPYEKDSALIMVRDMSTRRQTETALKDSQQRYEVLYNKTPIMLHSVDNWGHIVNVSDFWLQKMGYERYEVIGRTLLDFLTDTSRQYVQDVVLPNYLKTGSCIDVPYQMVTKAGEIIDVLLSATAEHNSEGQMVRSLAVMTDVTARNQAIEALKVSEARFQAFMDNASVLAFMKDANTGKFLYINKPFEQFFHITLAEIFGKTDADWLPPEAAKQNRQNDLRAMELSEPLQLVESVPDRDGNPHEWLVSKFPCQASGTQKIVGAIAINITAQKQLERKLYEEKELAQVTLNSIGDAVITTDAWGNITYFNPVAEVLTGWSHNEAKGLPLCEVFIILNEDTREPVESPVIRVLREGKVTGLANHTILISRDGKERAIEDSAAPIRNKEREIVGTVLVFHDVTEARQLSRRLSWQASHDELTQLANRREFEKRVAELLKTSRAKGVLCYLDLDQFKLVNDTCGHAAGDVLLRQVADLLKSHVRSTDTVARLGGDEFAVLLPQCSLEFARRIANMMRQSIREFRFVWGKQSFSIGASMGLVELIPEGHNLQEVLAAADAACYAAKEAGRDRVHVYRADDSTLSRRRNQQEWCLRIDKAFEENRFCLYHQPIVPLHKKEAPSHHSELLLRLVDEKGKLISPMAFIPAAERYHRMSQIDQWVIRRFLKILSNIQDDSQVLYNINLSGASLNDEEFLKFLKKTLKESAINPIKLCFEITETSAIANLARAASFMRNLKQLGCQFALDDFGSGMSSFSYLKQLPVDYIKIDGSFVQHLSDPVNRAIIDSICKVGRAMKALIIAERVEDAPTMTHLKALGVDYVQGYGIAKPSPFPLDKTIIQHA